MEQQAIRDIPPPPPKRRLTPEQTAEAARLCMELIRGRMSEAQAIARMAQL